MVALSDNTLLLGDGSDGNITLDGVTAYPGTFGTPAGNVYTQVRTVFCTVLTVNAGVTLKPNNYPVLCTQAFINNGTVQANGNNAAGSGGGANLGSGLYFGGRGGGSGGTGVSGAGANGGGATVGNTGGNGGAGTSGAAGLAGAGVQVTAANAAFVLRNQEAALTGCMFGGAPVNPMGTGSGGGGGGSDASSNAGGGGGGGGSIICISAPAIVNNGTFSATGGNGAAGAAGNAGGGGGGSGGAILTYSTGAIQGSNTQTVTGGALGAGVGTGANGVAGGAGFILNAVP